MDLFGLTIDFSDTNVRIYLVPFASTIITIAVLRIIMGAFRGSILATMGIASGFLVSYFLVRGFDLWPAVGPLGLLPYVAIAAIVVGTFMDIHDAPPNVVNLAMMALSMVIVFWVALEWNSGVINGDGLVLYGVLIAAGFWAMQRLYENRDNGLASPLSVGLALAGLAIIATIYETRTGLFASAMASAILGYMIFNWPQYRYPWGVVGTFAAGGVYLNLAAELAIKNEALAFPVGTTLICFIIYPFMARFLPVPKGVQPIVQIAISIIPLFAAGYLAKYGF